MIKMPVGKKDAAECRALLRQTGGDIPTVYTGVDQKRIGAIDEQIGIAFPKGAIKGNKLHAELLSQMGIPLHIIVPLYHILPYL